MSVIKAKGKITCDYSPILRENDYKVKYGTTTRTSGFYTLIESDFVRANCWTDSLIEKWTGIVLGIREDITISERKNWNGDSALNVLMFGFDSLSRNAFIRKLPKAYYYMTESLKTDVLEGYNIVGDGKHNSYIFNVETCFYIIGTHIINS